MKITQTRVGPHRGPTLGKRTKNKSLLYDNVGNLTEVEYPSSHPAAFGYDALNRLTNMVDAAGTTVYTYTSAGQLFTEDGPFASDTHKARICTGPSEMTQSRTAIQTADSCQGQSFFA